MIICNVHYLPSSTLALAKGIGDNHYYQVAFKIGQLRSVRAEVSKHEPVCTSIPLKKQLQASLEISIPWGCFFLALCPAMRRAYYAQGERVNLERNLVWAALAFVCCSTIPRVRGAASGGALAGRPLSNPVNPVNPVQYQGAFKRVR